MKFTISIIFTGEAIESMPVVTTCHFKVGDKVRCDLDMDVLKQMQEGHGGWNQRMSEVRFFIKIIRFISIDLLSFTKLKQ